MNSEAIKTLVVSALEDIKAVDIVVLDVREQTDITDYMVVASGATNRQVKALAGHVVVQAKAGQVPILGVEGLEDGGWVLIDLVDLIVHVMLPEMREFYDLERLWSLGPVKPGAKRV